MPSRRPPLLVQYKRIQHDVRAGGKHGANGDDRELSPCIPNIVPRERTSGRRHLFCSWRVHPTFWAIRGD